MPEIKLQSPSCVSCCLYHPIQVSIIGGNRNKNTNFKGLWRVIEKLEIGGNGWHNTYYVEVA